MSELILHHYANSPFSEKVRRILAYKRLHWKSVTIPRIMPKPDVVELTGGYRRTPFAQMGADIYCDTALICDLLETTQSEPSLFPDGSEGLARLLAQWLDGGLFWSTMAYAFQPAGLAAIFEGSPPGTAEAFAEDRAKMRAGAARLPAATARVQFRNALGWLEQGLIQSSFLLGDKPCLADFSAYHSLWFVKHQARIAGAFDATPAVTAWMERMAALGQGAPEPVKSSAGEAIELAAQSTPEPIRPAPLVDCPKLEVGQRVTVTPVDYGFDPVEGELLQATAQRVSIRRQAPRAGILHVHFPRIGFEIKGAGA